MAVMHPVAPLILAAFLVQVAHASLASIAIPATGTARRASSGLFDTESDQESAHVLPGQTVQIADLRGPGTIRHAWFVIGPDDRRWPRNLVLAIYWDGATTPSVRTPIGDFFAAGNGMHATVHSSLPVEVSSYGRALNCYWPMPFRRRAVIEVTNDSPDTTTDVFYQIDWNQGPIETNAMLFHALYRQDYNPKPFSYYDVANITGGRGQFVGTVISSVNQLGSWFGEGSDRWYIDGALEPQIVGTGTEDFFNDGWNLRLFQDLRRGVTIMEAPHDGIGERLTAYRWFVDNPITFNKSLAFNMERRSYADATAPNGTTVTFKFKYRPDHYSSVAFFYFDGVYNPSSSPEAAAFWDLPPGPKRIPSAGAPEAWLEVPQLLAAPRAPSVSVREAVMRVAHQKRAFVADVPAPAASGPHAGWLSFPINVSKAGLWSVQVRKIVRPAGGGWNISASMAGSGEPLPFLPTTHGVAVPRTTAWRELSFYDEIRYPAQSRFDWPENRDIGTLVEQTVGVLNVSKAGAVELRFTSVSGPGILQAANSLTLDGVYVRRLAIADPWNFMQQYLKAEAAYQSDQATGAAHDVVTLVGAVEAYAKAHDGRLPPSLADFSPTLDPYHQQYMYRAPGTQRPWAFDVWSRKGNSHDPAAWVGNWKRPYAVVANELAAVPGAWGAEGEALGAAAVANRSSPGVVPTVQRLASTCGAPISGGALLFVAMHAAGDWIELDVARPHAVHAGQYHVFVLFVTSWNYGTVAWTACDRGSGECVGATVDTRESTCISGAAIGRTTSRSAEWTLAVSAGSGITLRLQVESKDRLSLGWNIGLDAVILIPV